MATSHKDHFIPFGEWKPDAIEFDSLTMEEVINFIPVYSGYRTATKLKEVSKLDSGYPVTGSFAHRTSQPVGVDVLQPVTTEETVIGIFTTPPSAENHQGIEGLFPNFNSFVSFESGAVEMTTWGLMTQPSAVWDQVAGFLTREYFYRVSPRISPGNNTIRVEYGTIEAGVKTPINSDQIIGTNSGDWIKNTLAVDLSTLPVDIDEKSFYWELAIGSGADKENWGEPFADEATGDFVPVGGEESLAASIDKVDNTDPDNPVEVPDDTKYAESAPLGDGEVGVFVVELLYVKAPVRTDVHAFFVSYLIPADGMALTCRLLEKDGEGELIERAEFSETPGASALVRETFFATTPEQSASVEDWGRAFIELGFIGPPEAGPTTVNYRPDPSFAPSNWNLVGDGNLGDSDDATGLSKGGSTAKSLIPTLGINEIPSTEGDYIARCRINPMGGRYKGELRVRYLAEDGTWKEPNELKVPFDFSDSDWHEVELDWTANRTLVDNWEDVRIRVFHTNVTTSGVECSEIWMALPGALGATGRIVALRDDTKDSTFVDVSFLQLQADLDGEFNPGDRVRAYMGTHNKVYEIDPDGTTPDWKDVTDPLGDYTIEGGKSWSMAAYGDRLMLTNYIDPVQVLDLGAADLRKHIGFDNLGVDLDPEYSAAGGERPRARFIATINAFLCLGNVDQLSYVDGRPYTFWSSRIQNPNEFYPADFDFQSAIFQIVSTPGEITALRGGEYGMLFKENSIFRVEYVAGLTAFNFPMVSKFMGTPYPRSIVKYGQHTFFVSVGGVFMIENDTQLREIGEGKISKWLFDTLFEPFSLSSSVYSDERQNSSKVIGTYDTHSGLIIWSIVTRQSDHPFFGNSMIIYNPQRDQFTVLLGDQVVTGGYEVTDILGLGNRLVSNSATVKNVIITERDDPEQEFPLITANRSKTFSAESVDVSVMQTNTIPSSTFPKVEIGEDVQIQMVRPIFRTEPGTPNPEIEITIIAGQSAVVENVSRTIMISSVDARSDGYISLADPLLGEWFKFRAELKPAPVLGVEPLPSTKEFLGLQVTFAHGGDF